MEAKAKKVIQQEILEMYPRTIPDMDIDWDMMEISFKAGYFEGRGLGIRDGIREVVEWIEKKTIIRTPFMSPFNSPTAPPYLELGLKEWQNQKKEWNYEKT